LHVLEAIVEIYTASLLYVCTMIGIVWIARC